MIGAPRVFFHMIYTAMAVLLHLQSLPAISPIEYFLSITAAVHGPFQAAEFFSG
jgi:hypothetical protein